MSVRVLVTGGAGFIGSHVVDALRQAGHEPVIFDVRPSPWHGPETETILGDVADLDALVGARGGCDAVAHLAAAADVDGVARDPLGAEQLNTGGTAKLLEAARRAGVGRVLYASTIWVYSDVAAEWVDEDTPLQPPAHLYTATKLAGELYCRSYAELYGVDCTVLRFGIPYGPRARPAAVVPAMVGRALKGEPLIVAGDGAQTRRFVYVEDLADGVVRSLAPGAANRVYNLVGDADISIRQVADTVRAAVGDVEIVHAPGRPGDLGSVHVDGSRAARELGWRPTTGFEAGVRRYVASLAAPRAPVAVPARDRPALVATVGRVLAPTVLLGVLVACLAAAGSVEQIAAEAPVALFAMAIGLPIAVATALDWSAPGRRLLRQALLGLATGCVVLFAVHVPGTGAVHQHAALALSLAASSLVAAGLTLGGARATLRPRSSEG